MTAAQQSAPVVVGFGRSASGAAALRHAACVARARGTSLEVVHAFELPAITTVRTPDVTDRRRGVRRRDEAWVRRTLGSYRDGLEMALQVWCATAEDALLAAAARAQLLVVGTPEDRVLLEHLRTYSPVPVVEVSPDGFPCCITRGTARPPLPTAPRGRTGAPPSR
jgi:hypothetical protein